MSGRGVLSDRIEPSVRLLMQIHNDPCTSFLNTTPRRAANYGKLHVKLANESISRRNSKNPGDFIHDFVPC